jgi:hypothetical protein
MSQCDNLLDSLTDGLFHSASTIYLIHHCYCNSVQLLSIRKDGTSSVNLYRPYSILQSAGVGITVPSAVMFVSFLHSLTKGNIWKHAH